MLIHPVYNSLHLLIPNSQSLPPPPPPPCARLLSGSSAEMQLLTSGRELAPTCARRARFPPSGARGPGRCEASAPVGCTWPRCSVTGGITQHFPLGNWSLSLLGGKVVITVTDTIHFKGDPFSKRASDIWSHIRGKYWILQEGGEKMLV